MPNGTIKQNFVRYSSNSNPDCCKTIEHKNPNPLKKVITLFFIVNALSGIAQTAITGAINTTLTVPKVQRNFMGFHSGDDNLESIYNMNGPGTGLEVNANFFDAFA